MVNRYVRNAKARKALARIKNGAPRIGDDARVARLAEAFHARTQPRSPRERTRKQHEHPLRDEHGAYTCVGSTYEVEGMAPDTDREHVTSSWVHGEDMGYTARRKWLAGISAQRGY